MAIFSAETTVSPVSSTPLAAPMVLTYDTDNIDTFSLRADPNDSSKSIFIYFLRSRGSNTFSSGPAHVNISVDVINNIIKPPDITIEYVDPNNGIATVPSGDTSTTFQLFSPSAGTQVWDVTITDNPTGSGSITSQSDSGGNFYFTWDKGTPTTEGTVTFSVSLTIGSDTVTKPCSAIIAVPAGYPVIEWSVPDTSQIMYMDYYGGPTTVSVKLKAIPDSIWSETVIKTLASGSEVSNDIQVYPTMFLSTGVTAAADPSENPDSGSGVIEIDVTATLGVDSNTTNLIFVIAPYATYNPTSKSKTIGITYSNIWGIASNTPCIVELINFNAGTTNTLAYVGGSESGGTVSQFGAAKKTGLNASPGTATFDLKVTSKSDTRCAYTFEGFSATFV